MIKWTGLAPWEFEFPPVQCLKLTRASHLLATPSLFATLTLLPPQLPHLKVSLSLLLLSFNSLVLSDTQVYKP